MADERKGLKAEYSDDGVHPNKTGYKLMTPLVEKTIALALSIKQRNNEVNLRYLYIY